MIKRILPIILCVCLLITAASCSRDQQDDESATRPPVWEMDGDEASKILEKEPEPEKEQEQKSGSSSRTGESTEKKQKPQQKNNSSSLPSGYAKNDSARFSGVWRCTVNLFDIFDTEDDFILNNTMNVGFIMEFDSDGYYKMYLDAASADAAKGEIAEKYRQHMIDAAANYMVENGITDISPEDYLRQQNYDLETCGRKFTDGLDVDGIIADHTHEGRFDALDGKLMLSSGRQYAVSTKNYFLYSISGTAFTLTGGVGDNERRFLDAFNYPMKFEKQ